MSTDSSVSDAVENTDGEFAATPQARPRRVPPVHTGEDGATTPGGPNMILLLLSGFIAFKVWRYRRRRASRA